MKRPPQTRGLFSRATVAKPTNKTEWSQSVRLLLQTRILQADIDRFGISTPLDFTMRLKVDPSGRILTAAMRQPLGVESLDPMLPDHVLGMAPFFPFTADMNANAMTVVLPVGIEAYPAPE